MQKIYQASKLPFALTTLCLMLSACGGGSNTINEDPTGGGTGNVVSECPTSNATCVDVLFDDTPVVNLNYECGTYRGLTTATGVARCPIDSNVTFFLKNPDNARRVTLGTVAVKPVRNVIASEAGSDSLIRITTKDLAEATTNTAITSLDSTVGATAAINMSRLLQTLARTSEPYIDSAPINRVYIDTDVKTGIEKLEKDIVPADFQSNEIVAKLQPWLEIQKRTLISADEAKRRLNKVVVTKNAGIFTATPTLDVDVSEAGKITSGLDLKLGVSSTNSKDKFASIAMYSSVDRSGQNTGFGLQWVMDTSSNTTTLADRYKIYLKNNFSKMSLTTPQAGFNPYTKRFSNFSFNVGPKTYTSADANTYNGDVFSFANGKLVRDVAVLGSSDVYELYTNEAIKDRSELGTWEQKSSIGSTNFSGTATVSKLGSVNTYLDPAVWRVKDGVKTGETYLFPLYMTLTLNYDKAYTDACSTCAASQTIPVAVLENGDIITDGDNSAAFAGSKAMCGEGGIAQKRIGTVRAAAPSGDGSQLFFNPSILLAGSQFGALDGTVIGIDSRIKINLAGIRNVATGQRGSLNATSSELGDTDQRSAPWFNIYNLFTSLRVDYEPATNETVAAITPEQKLAANQSAGTLQANTSECYKVYQK